VFIIFFSQNPSLNANSQPVPQAQICGISYLFLIWPRPWCFLTKHLFPPFQAIISIFAPQCSLSSSPKILQSMRTHSLFLKHKFVVLVTCFKFDLALDVSLPNIYSSPPFKQLSPFFAPQCSLFSSSKVLHSMRIHSLFLKHKFVVLVTCFKFDLVLNVSLPNIYSPSFKQLSPIFSPQCSLSSSPKIFHSMRIHSLFLKHKFLVIVICLKFDLALQVSLPPTL